MAKITSLDFGKYKFEIKYSVRHQNFFSVLPPDVSVFTNEETLDAPTLSELKNKIRKVYDSFLKKGSKKEKVIAVHFKRDDRTQSHWENEYVNADGATQEMKFEYCVLYRVTGYDNKVSYRTTEARYFREDSDTVFVDYSESREEFFKTMTAAIGDLGEKIQKFLNNENLVGLIESKTDIPFLK